MDLVFTYTDGRVPAARTITVSAAKVHELLRLGRPMKLEDESAYLGWCESEGVESALPEADPQPKPVTETAPNGAQDGWPDGATWSKAGSWYTGEMNGQTFKAQGENKAQEAAWALA